MVTRNDIRLTETHFNDSTFDARLPLAAREGDRGRCVGRAGDSGGSPLEPIAAIPSRLLSATVWQQSALV